MKIIISASAGNLFQGGGKGGGEMFLFQEFVGTAVH